VSINRRNWPRKRRNPSQNEQASNLVDGDTSTPAVSGANQIDYAIHLNGQNHITGASIHWGPYGTQPGSITSWSLQGRNGLGAWQVLQSGTSPGTSVSDFWVDALVTDLRILVSGPNAVGVYEVTPYGEDTAPVRPSGVTSNVVQDPTYSLAAGYAASNLIDGNSTTLAYPASTNIDYQIAVSSTPVRVSSATIRWGTFGSSTGYVDSWRLLALDATGNWLTVASGGFPGVDTSTVFFDTISTQLRLVASSNENWIGAYEMSITQAPLGPTVSSNVPTDPTNCQANNLIDGNMQTLAYPGGPTLDYTITYPASVRATSATIVWGKYGSTTGYVNNWSLLAQNAAGTWVTVAGGGFPNANATTVTFDTTTTKLRLVASSTGNGIGAYEVRFMLSHPIATVVQPSQVFSNIVYSNPTSYPPSNLVDGNASTLAYPGAVGLDYQLEYASDTALETLALQWNGFGASAAYVDTWTVYGQRTGDTEWLPVASGGVPNASLTTVRIGRTFRRLRVTAASSTNWIGIYEATVTGDP
jgi:hypothetical protein